MRPHFASDPLCCSAPPHTAVSTPHHTPLLLRLPLGLPSSPASPLPQAYQYTSLTSVTLLDCFTIPAVIALSFFILGSRYRPRHYAAAALCVAGLALLVASEGRSSTAGQAPLLGDALVVAGALLYSISNVTQVGSRRLGPVWLFGMRGGLLGGRGRGL